MPTDTKAFAKLRSRLTGTVGYILAGWVSLALIGYGLALRSYVDNEHRVASGKFGGNYRVIEGPVDKFREPFLGFGDPEFTVKGFGDRFVVPREFLTPSMAENLSRVLAPGTHVWLAYRLRGNWAVQLDANPRTSMAKSVVDPTLADKMVEAHLLGISDRGGTLLILGFLAFPLFLGVRRLLKGARSPSAAPRAGSGRTGSASPS